MFGSAMLGIAIGMVFVFLTMSLAVTAGNELLASLLRWRAKVLEAGIKRLLGVLAKNQPDTKAAEFLSSFLRHSMIKSLARTDDAKPSYIPARTFAIVLLQLAELKPDADVAALQGAVKKSDVLPGHLKEVLGALLDQVAMEIRTGENALAKLQRAVESWFDGAMDRVGGWYKRRTQYVSLALAAILAGALNLDSIEMTQRLSKNTTLRQAIAAQAAQLAPRPPAPTDAQGGGNAAPTPEQVTAQTVASYEKLAKGVREIKGLGLSADWHEAGLDFGALDSGGDKARWVLAKVLGLLLTALAASLGAPFWFDVLGRLIAIRGSGKVPEKAPKSVPVP